MTSADVRWNWATQPSRAQSPDSQSSESTKWLLFKPLNSDAVCYKVIDKLQKLVLEIDCDYKHLKHVPGTNPILIPPPLYNVSEKKTEHTSLYTDVYFM